MTALSSSTSRLRGVACAALAALTAASCTVGPNFHPQSGPMEQSYAMPGDDVNQGQVRAVIGAKVVADWWTLFQSPGIDALVRQAIAGNPTLEEARARLQAAHQSVLAETGNLTIDGNAGAERQRANLSAFGGGAFTSFLPPGSGLSANPEFNLYSIGASVDYNLDIFGGHRRRVESLHATEESQARALDAAYLTLTGQVVEQALIIGDANVQAGYLQDIVNDDQRTLDIIKRSREAGGASESDVASAESQLAQDRSLIPAQLQRRAAARHALAVLLGRTPESWSPPDFDATSGVLPTTLPLSIPSELVHNRPDILEAEAKLHAAIAQIGVAQAARYPNIDLTAMIEQQALEPQNLFNYSATSWTIAAGLTTPIFHSGQLLAKQRQAEAEAKEAFAAYQLTVLQAFAQVADILSSLAHDNQTYADQTRALEEAQKRVDMLRKGYELGGVSAQQLLDAQRNWARTRLALSQQGFSRVGDAALLLLATANVPPGAAEGKEQQANAGR